MEGDTIVTQVIPTQNISYMAIEIVIAVMLPLTVLLIWKYNKKKKAEFFTTFAGACVYFTFSIVGRMVVDTLVVGNENGFSAFLNRSVWIVSIYAALLIGLLEETGRFICLKFILGDDENRTTAISYGIGHGGLECMYVLGYTMLGYFMLATQLNVMGLDSVTQAIQTQESDMYFATIEGMKAIGISQVCIALYERCMFLVFQIALSVFMFVAVHYKERRVFFIIAILLHSGLEFFMSLGAIGVFTNVIIHELLLSVFVLITAFFAYRYYQKLYED